MIYRFRVRSQSLHCGYSGWSEVRYISTPKNLTAYIEVQGTSYYNPLDTYIKLNGTTLYKGSFTGFMLSVINRCSLQQVFQQIYDTYSDSTQADLLAEKIRTYDSNHIIIIASCYAWEPYFNKNLAHALTELGGYLTLPFTKPIPPTPIYKSEEVSIIGHPYAFIGIPGQRYVTGQNFEVLRNSTNYFNYDDEIHNALPTARIRVNLVFDTYRQFYMLENNHRIFRMNKV